MRLLVLSDLHVEFAPFQAVQGRQRIDQGVDVVILAGDIHVGTQGLVWARLSQINPLFMCRVTMSCTTGIGATPLISCANKPAFRMFTC